MAPHAISALLGRDDDFFYGDSFWYSRVCYLYLGLIPISKKDHSQNR